MRRPQPVGPMDPRAPRPARGPMPGPPGRPPGGQRNLAPRRQPDPRRVPPGGPRPRRTTARASRHGRTGTRNLILAGLGLATVGVLFFVVQGGSSDAPTGFVRAERDFTRAATAMSNAADNVHFGQGDPTFEAVFVANEPAMIASTATMRQVERDEDGDAARIAGDAADAAERGHNAATTLRQALYDTDVEEITDAANELRASIRELEQQRRAWGNL